MCGGACGLSVVRGKCRRPGVSEVRAAMEHFVCGRDSKMETLGEDSCCQDNIIPGHGRSAFTGAGRCVQPAILKGPAESEGMVSLRRVHAPTGE